MESEGNDWQTQLSFVDYSRDEMAFSSAILCFCFSCGTTFGASKNSSDEKCSRLDSL